MTDALAAACLLGGALISLLAAVGVLRLPDVFMRMHAATKSGVVGCGLVLVAVAFADGTPSTAVKVAVATLFLLLTTPVAGHLLGRAAYVSGAPLWSGTVDNQLTSVLPRRRFGPRRQQRSTATAHQAATASGVSEVLLALAQGPHIARAIDEAIALVRRNEALLCGVAIIDEPRLFNVGPIPIGGGHHAAELREWRLAKARQAAADVIQLFEAQARAAGIRHMVRLEEGKPQAILRSLQGPGHVVAIAPGGWFDQGVLERDFNIVRRLIHSGVSPLAILGVAPMEVDRIRFLHDGSSRSWATWRWLLDANLWSTARIIVNVAPGSDPSCLAQALEEAHARGRQAEQAETLNDASDYLVIGNVESDLWLPRWFTRRRSARDARVVVVG